MEPLPGKGGTTPNSHVDAQVNLVRLRSNAVLACNTALYNGIRVEGVNGKGIKIKDLDRGK